MRKMRMAAFCFSLKLRKEASDPPLGARRKPPAHRAEPLSSAAFRVFDYSASAMVSGASFSTSFIAPSSKVIIETLF